MGILRDSLKALVPSRGTERAVAATIPVGMAGVPQNPPHSFERNAREGYMRDELVYSCVEMLATSAAEPRLVAYRGDEKITEHPLLDLWEHPNPFLDRFTLVASLIMYRAIGGNAYLELVRSGAGKIVEVWVMRPDRVRVIPDERTHVGGYRYQYGGLTYDLPAQDMIHFKTRHPLDDFYGLPPLAPLAGRVDLDNWMRDFTRAFFQNAGVPAGLLNIQRSVGQEERELIRARFRSEYGGAQGWHNLMVIDGGEASYTAMGLPLGARGIAAPELDEMNEARICMCFGVPPSLIGTRVGMQTGSYANRRQDETNFWELTLVPLYRELGATLSRALCPEYPDLDRIEFDVDDVRALAEDVDALHTRVREDYKVGLVAQKEARVLLGYEEKPPADDFFLLPSSGQPTKYADFDAPALPPPMPGDPNSPDYQGVLPGEKPLAALNGKPTNGKVPAGTGGLKALP